MKTAMQELIDELKLIEAYPMSPVVLRMATDLLEKEKKQIIATYRVGKAEAKMFPELNTTGEEYYNQTYNQNK